MSPARIGIIVLAVTAVFGPRTAGAQADSLDDGPHVFWRDGGDVVVLSLCDDTLATVRLSAPDTARVRSACRDGPPAVTVRRRPPAAWPVAWPDPPRVLAVSDIHGEYEALVTFLRGTGVVDDDLHWRWGPGHLVVVGDVFDRGDRVTECLWLLYRLEREAAAAGGAVHLVIGNHEMMVLRDDLRYVNAKYLRGIVRRSRIRYPDLFGPDTELGRWLRTKPLVLKLGDVLFVHGGLAPDLVARGLDLESINQVGRSSLDLSSSDLAFSDLPRLLYGTRGPLWYRGYHYGIDGSYPATDEAGLSAVLTHFGVRAIVVGHSEIDHVAALHGGRVYGIDVPVDGPGALEGLLWQDGRFASVSAAGVVRPLD